MMVSVAAKQGISTVLRTLDRLPGGQAGELQGIPAIVAQVSGWRAVAEAAAQMPAGPRRSEWLQQAVGALTRDGETSAAEKIIARLPDGPDREQALRAVGAASFSQDPDAGAALLLRSADGVKAIAEEARQWIKRMRQRRGGRFPGRRCSMQR
jgi:hypothetical protein